MPQVLKIEPSEPVLLDEDRLTALYAQLGEAGAEDVVSRAMQELSARLAECGHLYTDGNYRRLRKSARSLIAISEQVGLPRLAQVAGDVTTCLDKEDEAGLGATLHRLLRIGQTSLVMIWEP